MRKAISRCSSFLLIGAVIALSASAGLAEEPMLTPAAAAFFEQKIRPLLIERCYPCHSEAKKIKGGLALDTRAGWIKGGESGPAIVPGKPDESRLIKAVRYADPDLQMPPGGKLAEAEIKLLEEWVSLGAPDPREEPKKDSDPGKNAVGTGAHWAFQPLRDSVAPSIRDARWPFDPLDAFILAALEAEGLKPSPEADRYAWLRRVSLDLTGLPPTPHEIQSFLDDASADPYERVVDRLLSSRAFGERWARPWLDLVGYADQIGSANNVPAEHAWRYRDYVIRAMAADKPFDEFVREQLAGDLLAAGSIEQRQDQLTATGFLVLGNVNIVESDKLVMRMDLVDQQVEKVGKTFLAMTLNCVRCHDHKFDPITLSDYYGLAGIFASTESTYKDDRGVWSSVVKAPLPETFEQFTRREAARRAHEQQVAAVLRERGKAEEKLQALEPAIKAAKANNAAASADGRPLAELEKEAADLAANLKTFEQKLLHLHYLEPLPPVAFAVKDGPEIANAHVQVRGNPHVLGAEVPRGFVQAA
ncbi:MAG TPA: DUF1549 domain-containing protein, partial [Planctomycetaceae bacterium]|nr:DUF1549 domain-containing protein [Planctomycetaceae bacterium]